MFAGLVLVGHAARRARKLSSGPLADKFGLPSSVAIANVTETRDRIRFRIKDDFNLDGEPFIEFLNSAHVAFPK